MFALFEAPDGPAKPMERSDFATTELRYPPPRSASVSPSSVLCRGFVAGIMAARRPLCCAPVPDLPVAPLPPCAPCAPCAVLTSPPQLVEEYQFPQFEAQNLFSGIWNLPGSSNPERKISR